MLPQSAFRCFEQPFSGLSQRHGVVSLEKFLLLGRKQKRLRDFFVVMILDEIRRRVVAEKVIDRRSHLECAFVTVLAHRFDPARIQNAAADHAHQLFLQRPNAKLIGAARVAVVIRRRAAAKLLDAGLEPALELKIIVGVENVVFAIVLILMHDLDFGEPLAEQADGLARGAIAVERMPAPFAKDIGQIAFRTPISGIDQR